MSNNGSVDNWVGDLFRFGKRVAVPLPDANYQLTNQEAAAKVVTLTGTLTAPRNVVAPAKPGADYIVKNETNQAIVWKPPTGSGVTIASGSSSPVYHDGTSYLAASVATNSVTSDGFVQVTLSDAGATTLNQAQYDSRAIEFIGTLTADQSGIVPLGGNRGWMIRNSTTGGYSVRVRGATGAGVSIGNGQLKTCVSTASSVVGDALVAVESIARMKALVPVAGQVANVRGFYVAGDGGGGDFDWDAASTATVDGGTVFASNAGGTGRWKRRNVDPLYVNPKQFGVTSDGTTDDYAAWVLTMTYAKARPSVVMVPRGTSRIYTALNVTPTSYPLAIRGTGSACVIQGPSQGVVPAFDDVFTGQNMTARLTLANFKIDANGAARCVDVNVSSEPIDIVDDMHFTGCAKIATAGKGTLGIITLIGCDDVTIERFHIYGNGEIGPKTCRTYAILSSANGNTTNKRWKIRNGDIASAGTTCGISLFDTEDVEITGNDIDQGGVDSIYDGTGGDGYGIFGYNHYLTDQDPKKFIVDKNNVRNTAGNGIYIQTIRHAKVTNNLLADCGLVMANGISLLGGAIAVSNSVTPFENFATVTGNTIIRGYRDAITVGGLDNIIMHNHMIDVSDVGVRLGGTTRNKVSKNIIERTLGRSAWIRGIPAVSRFSTVDHTDYIDLLIDGVALTRVSFADTDITGALVAEKIRQTIKATTTSVTSSGTSPPVATLAGTPNQAIVLRVQVLTSGARGVWTGKYSIDYGVNWTTFTSSSSPMTLFNPLTGLTTGVTISFANTSASLNNVWTARAHQGLAIVNCCEDEDAGFATHLIIQSRSFGSGSSVAIAATSNALTLPKLGFGDLVAGGSTAIPGSAAMIAFALAGGLYSPGGATNAIWAYGTCYDGEISDNTIKTPSASGIFVTDGRGITIARNQVDGATSQQIVIAAGTHNMIVHNKMINGLNHGLDVRGSDNTFHGNEAIGNVTDGFHDQGTRNIGFYNKSSGNGTNDNSGGATTPIRPDPNGAVLPLTAALTVGHVAKVTGTSAWSMGYLANANVDTAAAIAGTKIAPDFGSQLVQTTGGFGASGTVSLLPSSGVSRFDLTTASITYSVPLLICNANQGSFQFYQGDQTDGVTDGKQATWRAQTSNATNGGGLDIKSGVGATNPGLFRLYAGASLRVSMNGTGISFLAVTTPVGVQTVGAAASDPATTQTLANNMRTALINFGLCAA